LSNEGNNPNGTSSIDVMSSQHVLVCATQEIGSLMKALGTAALPLINDAQSSE